MRNILKERTLQRHLHENSKPRVVCPECRKLYDHCVLLGDSIDSIKKNKETLIDAA
jgi:hypothetical protein